MRQKIVIRIGHGAYTGNNALFMCFSKAQAVRVLRMRGVTRDNARKAVQNALDGTRGWVAAPEGWPSTIEVTDYSYVCNDYNRSRASWRNAAEC